MKVSLNTRSGHQNLKISIIEQLWCVLERRVEICIIQLQIELKLYKRLEESQLYIKYTFLNITSVPSILSNPCSENLS